MSIIQSSPTPNNDWKEFRQWLTSHVKVMERFSNKVSQTKPKNVVTALYDIPMNSPRPSLIDFDQFKIWLLGKLDEINKLIK